MSGQLLDTYPSGATIYALFASYNSAGASVTLTGLAVTDIEIYKDGSTTQRSSDAGYTLLDTDGIDFDSLTGIHGVSIDLSNNTDSGFYAVGSQYTVVVSAVTIDSQTVSFILGSFRIVAAEGVAGKPKVDVDAFGGTAGTFSGGRPEVNTSHAAGTAWNSGAITANTLAADAITDAKVASDVTIASVTGAVGSVTGAVGSVTGNVGGNVTGTVASVVGNVGGNVTGSVGSIATGGIAAASFAAGAINAAAIANGAIDAATFAGDVTGSNFTAIPWNASWDAEVQSEVADALAAFGAATEANVSAVGAAVLVVDGIVDDILVDTGTTIPGLISGLSIPTAAQNATELLDQAAGVETGLTVRQHFRLASAVLFGKSSGLETATAVYRNIGDSVDRITATVDADGNRSAVTRNAA
jgi:hypothetical protein